MPYIPRDQRATVIAMGADTVGQLAYEITQVCVDYLGTDYNFAALAEVISALECSKLEMYRRVVAPYEASKCLDNGDVYRSRADGRSSYDLRGSEPGAERR